nr:immunoglobulin light chain junction region [Macaca mulatta]MPN67041.1 immunoglobulin light chain junction region [Macaca mulatta]MPN67657.1 immunoglobulin light chain junction region [Macaca mulatta]MPN68356.1 immunoglobulin light chain junction region [Macaca mulatta]
CQGWDSSSDHGLF